MTQLGRKLGFPIAIVIAGAGCRAPEPAMGEDGDDTPAAEWGDEGPEASETHGLDPDVPDEGCALYQQDCPVGQKCAPAMGDPATAICVPVVDDPAGVGEPCSYQGGPYSGFDDCEAGSYCEWIDEQGVGVCVALCSAELGLDCGPEQTCMSGHGRYWSRCLQACDPRVGCELGWSCSNDWLTFACIHVPFEPTAALGEACNDWLECALGLACWPGPDFSNSCRPLCTLGEVCPLPWSCMAYYARGDAPAGLEDLGVCW